ncbi:MAG: DUF86 domain-containing protein [Acidimicrobiia bacterium]|nr:DUF86 domain-containing protein [Acidimicrobiia bacterium]
MTLDSELVTRKLLLITADLDQLRDIHSGGETAYLASRVDQVVCERLLERIVTRMIDINYHVLTASGHPPPSDYHSSFQQLGVVGILDPVFASGIAKAAGLRNRLVHDYDDIDQRLLFAAVTGALEDVKT